jgi:hypothetical protein
MDGQTARTAPPTNSTPINAEPSPVVPLVLPAVEQTRTKTNPVGEESEGNTFRQKLAEGWYVHKHK